MVNEASDHCGDEDRRSSWRELHALVLDIQHEFDKRISIVEVRMSGQDGRLGNIEVDMRATKQGIQHVLDVLNTHVEQEQKDRSKLFVGIIATLLSVLGFAGTALINHLLR